MASNNPPNGMGRGLFVERFIGNFSSQLFMKDLVYINAKYTSGGQLKSHPADLLFVLDDECIVVSVKGTDGGQKSEEKLKLWLKKKTWDGSQAAKVGIQRLRIPFSAENLWSERKDFQPGSLKARCGICVLECSQEPFKAIDFEISQPECAVPIHILSANDLLNATLWLGSVWDVFQYFDKRATIRTSFTGINGERFPLAYYVLKAHEFSGYASADREELGTQFQLHMLDNLGKYAERDRFSHYVNSIIHALHTRHPELESFVPREFSRDIEPAEGRTAYLKMAAMLNGLPSSNKAYIGRRLHDMLIGLKGTGKCGCVAHKRLYEETVFVFCGFSKMSRTERIRNMNTLVEAALLKYSVCEALGTAIDADDEATGYDLRWVRGTPVATLELARIAEAVFGSTMETSIANPFGEARPYTPPEKR
jgi:hypothetical protein